MKQLLGLRRCRLQGEEKFPPENHKGPEVKSGRLLLLQTMGPKTIRMPVFVRVYRSCFEHYAVMYQDKKYNSCSTFISLKNCTVMYNENCKTQLRVIPDNFEGTVIVFDTQDDTSVSSWRDAFQCSSTTTSACHGSISPNLSPVIPRSPVMPTLEEANEDE